MAAGSKTHKPHIGNIQGPLKVASLSLPHATRSELILIILGFVMKLLLQLGILVNNILQYQVRIYR